MHAASSSSCTTKTNRIKRLWIFDPARYRGREGSPLESLGLDPGLCLLGGGVGLAGDGSPEYREQIPAPPCEALRAVAAVFYDGFLSI